MNDRTSRIEETIRRENPPKFRYLPRLFAYVFRSAKAMCLIFLGLSMLLSLLQPVLALLWGRYIAVAETNAAQSLLGAAGLLAGYYLIQYLCQLLQRYTEWFEEIERLDVVQRNRFQELVDTHTYRKFASLPSEMFEVPAINDRIARFMRFTQDSWDGLNRKIMVSGYQIVAKAVSVASIAVSLYLLHPMLCWLVLIAPLPTLYTTYVADKLRFKFVKNNAKEKREADYYEKLILGQAAKEMKVLGLNDFFYSKWKRVIDGYIRKEQRSQWLSALLSLTGNIINSAATAASIVFAIVLMVRGALSLGALTAAMSLIRTLVGDMGSLMRATGSFLSKKNEAAMFFDVMDLPSQQEVDGTPVEVETIEAKDLSYRYPLTEKYVLEHVNLRIHRGEHIAFVGENGAGKTTLVRLLSGMLAPSRGELLVNGQIEDESGRARRYGAMASVLQSPAKYTTFTIGENVALGDPEKPASPQAIASALDAAGYGEADPTALLGKEIGGTDLSGGQWQKLAIARAHYRGRNFVLLDEPTGNLDPLAEAEVFQKYLDLSQGKTLIMVTHRISVASLADRIVVFAGGKIVEDGTHEELLQRGGEYARLYHEQAKWYDRTGAKA